MRKKGIDVCIVDARFAKPLDEDLLFEQAGRARLILTLEEHQRSGGFGSAVLECLSRNPSSRARVRTLAIPDRFIDHMTSRDEQLVVSGISVQDVVRSVEQSLRGVRS